MKIQKKKALISILATVTIMASSGMILTGCSNSNASQTQKQSKEPAVTPGTEIKLEGAINVRDLGGYKTTDGKTIKTHKLIRSAELAKLSEKDTETLRKEYNLKKIVDFRTDSEMKEKPDPKISGVEGIANPIMKDLGTSTSPKDFMKNLAKVENPEEYLIKANKGFVADEFSRKGYTKFFKTLLDNKDGAVLWHCTAGKDRAGFGTALVLSALGVDKETVMKDYLLTNKFRKEENEKTIAQVAKATNNNTKAVNAITAMMDVREVYLNAAFDQIDKDYGSVEGFLEKGLGLTQDDLKKLKSIYLA